MRFLLRAVLMLAILAMGAYLLGFWTPEDVRLRWSPGATPAPAAGSASSSAVRDRLDQLDSRAGHVAQKVGDYVSDAGVSAKIKSKMALDELVHARTVDVSTTDGVVTVSGTVRSVAERDQALRLARDTAGVTQVVNHLVVLP